MNWSGEKSTCIRVRCWAALMACAVGCAFAALNSAIEAMAYPQVPAHLAVVIFVSAAFSGGVTGWKLRALTTGNFSGNATAVRLGIRAGLIAVLWFSALHLCHAAFLSIRAQTEAVDLAARATFVMALLTCLASALPCVFIGCLGSLLVYRNLSDRSVSRSTEAVASRLPLPILIWSARIVPVLGLAAVLLSTLRLVQPLASDPAPRVASLPALPEPPAFQFSPLHELKGAFANQIELAFTKVVPNEGPSGPLSLSCAGNLLAFCAAAKGNWSVIAFDLHSFKELASFTVSDRPSALAWSPDNQQIACLVEGQRLLFLDLRSGAIMKIPRPIEKDLPNGSLMWRALSELEFYPSDEAPLRLDLGTLVLKPLISSEMPTNLGTTDKEPFVPLVETERWKFGMVQGLLANAPPPRRESAANWAFTRSLFCAFTDKELPSNHLLVGLPAEATDRILCSPDGSKIIRIAGNKIEVSYMRLGRGLPLSLEAEMPMSAEAIAGEEASRDVASKELCAFVYAPLVNPLNSQTVGPDHGHIKALIRLVSWQGAKARFLICHAIGSIDQKDVVATLHTWAGGQMIPWSDPGEAEWWTAAKIGSKEDPSRAEIAALKLEPLETPGSPVRRKSAPLPSESVPDVPVDKPSVSEASVLAFLQSHHQKASVGNLEGLVADYSEVMDFLNKGSIVAVRIWDEEYIHRQKWPKGEELIQGNMRVTRDGNLWRAEYAVAFRNENDSGDWQRGIANLSMIVAETAQGLRIVSQKASIRDLQQGKSR